MNTIIIQKEYRKALLSFLAKEKHSKIIVLVDENTLEYCYKRLEFEKFLPPHEIMLIHSGEEHKTLHTCVQIWQRMTQLELDRKSLFINLGGGVIGDMGGFCASTYKRGIDFIQVPTTLLSMVDASVGGKLGIDFEQYKNHIGVFRIPNAVLVSTDFLKTLPKNELRSGFAEVIKHCLIADQKKWDIISNNDWLSLDIEDLVKHSIQIKDAITTADPTEQGLRKILNFGHTLGHAVESHFLNTPKKLLHGEAIAIGMICECYLAFQLGFLSKTDLDSIVAYLLKIYGKPVVTNNDLDAILHLTRQDKKNAFSEVQFALIGPIGSCQHGIAVSAENMQQALEFYISC